MGSENVLGFEPVEYDEARAEFVGTTDFLLQTRPYELGKSVRLFPEPEDVFADAVGRHAEYFDPVASIDLSTVSPDLAGWVHVVLPTEVGAVGEYTEPFHNEFVSANWIAFRMVESRYRFLAAFGYFTTEGDPRLEQTPWRISEWEEVGPLQRVSYNERKRQYAESGWEPFRSKYPHPDTNDGPLHQFKQHPWQANWQVAPPPPSAFRIAAGGGVSTVDGRELVFVASVDPGRFRNDLHSGPDEALLFYDPIEDIALQTFDWT